MTNEEAIELIESARKTMYLPKSKEYISDFGYALEMAIKALEQQPCEDCISRQAVIEHICEDKECYKEDCKGRTLKRCPDLQWVLDLPSVTPTRTKGRWIEQKDIHKHHYGWSFCSECGAFLISSDGANYCSCCGAEMEAEA